MPYPLLNKVAIVTGSSRGLGREIALALASQGASIALTYVQEFEQAREVSHLIAGMGRKVIVVCANVANPLEVSSLFQQAVTLLGKVDIVISNAAVTYSRGLAETTLRDFDRVFDINTRGQFLVAQEAFKRMENGGRLIFISCTSARHTTSSNNAVYSASKAAVEAFARSFAVEFAPKEITVNAVAPSILATAMVIDESIQMILSRVPEARSWTDNKVRDTAADFIRPIPLLDPEKVAKVVVFLAGKEGACINGQVIDADGGFTK